MGRTLEIPGPDAENRLYRESSGFTDKKPYPPIRFDPENPSRLARDGGCNAFASTLGAVVQKEGVELMNAAQDVYPDPSMAFV